MMEQMIKFDWVKYKQQVYLGVYTPQVAGSITYYEALDTDGVVHISIGEAAEGMLQMACGEQVRVGVIVLDPGGSRCTNCSSISMEEIGMMGRVDRL